MLERHQVTAASQALHEHWRAGTKLAALEDWYRPVNRAEGYAIQARLEARSAQPLFGWKIAATSQAGQQHIGVDGPLAGRIRTERTAPRAPPGRNVGPGAPALERRAGTATRAGSVF